MFHKTSTKLTAFYLSILMFISLVFSIALYQISTVELKRGIDRPVPGAMEPFDDDVFERLRREIREDRRTQYEESSRRLISRLVVVNLLILGGGGLLSYYLARRTLRPIEEAHESLERFTSDASHELRTPLTVMTSENEVTLMNNKLSLKEAKAQLISNLEEVSKLTVLTDGLLRLSRHNGQELRKDTVDINQVVQAALKRVQKLADKKQVTIINEVTRGKVEVIGDEASLIESVVVVIDNAVKYSPVASKVTVAVNKLGKSVSIVVSDRGAGINQADLPYIFDRFYRSDTSRTNSSTQGYGLGLAIAKNIVEAHGGYIVVDTSAKGSTFKIVLPVA